MADTSATPAAPRVSRYRSKRQAAQQLTSNDQVSALPPPQPTDSPGPDDGVARTRSRYHRNRPATARDQDGTLAARPSTRHRRPGAPEPHENPLQSHPRDARSPDTTLAGAPDLRRLNSGDAVSYRSGDDAPRRPSTRSKEHGTPGPNEERPAMPPSQFSGELFPPMRPVEKAPEVKASNGPPQSSHIRATKSVTLLETYSDPEDDGGGGGCFGLFKRKRGQESVSSSDQMARQRKAGNGGGGMMDAPVSAVNAGDRRVRIQCGKAKITLPVTPETTAMDLVRSASNVMSERIDPKSAVLLEEFHSVGVTRPLRRYERVRDVMNSWASDTHNVLLIANPGTGSIEPELTTAGVPKAEPQLEKLLLYYSSQPGKWDKRYITLKSDGQLLFQRDEEKDHETTNICHLSDFDVYTPTPEKLKRKIKPPKKICYAVKSQQKSSMFESHSNFVHFFCTGSQSAGDDFYNAIQGWRSWYLVNVMGEGQKTKPKTTQMQQQQQPAVASRPSIEQTRSNSFARGQSQGQAQGHTRQQDSLGSHYQLGSFKPMFDDPDAQRPSTGRSYSGNANTTNGTGFQKGSAQFDPNISPERRASRRQRPQNGHPPLALRHNQLAEDEPLGNLARKTSVNTGRRTSSDGRRPDDFAPNTLLGRTYSKRQRETAEAPTSPAAEPGATFGTGAGMPRRHPSVRTALPKPSPQDPRRNTSTRHRGPAPSTDLARSASTRLQTTNKPLVDLTPASFEPPQHSKAGKGHGHVPLSVGPNGLVDAATSPDDVLSVPAAVDWRGRKAGASGGGRDGSGSPSRAATAAGAGVGAAVGGAGAGIARNGSLRRESPYSRPETSRSPARGAAGAATGNGEGGSSGSGSGSASGLVDRAAQGWGGGSKGRGRMDGSRAVGPMVGLGEERTFVQGSLLQRREEAGR